MKLAVIFPGIGYHTDKPLLYYSKKLAVKYGYEIKEVPYGGFESGIKGSKEKMFEAYKSALSQTEDILKTVDFGQYETLLFISKSIGTAVAASYETMHGISAGNLFYTPVEASFSAIGPEMKGVVFHGTNDSWAATDVIERNCRQRKLPLYITERGNHSLETGEVLPDIQNLRLIMEQSEAYIRQLEVSDKL